MLIVDEPRSLRPILRWAGGKSTMVATLAAHAPSDIGRYIEPMVGGGALYFHLRPNRAILADVNSDLINYYEILRDKPEALLKRLSPLKPSRTLYYHMRGESPRDRMDRAVRFAYLNRLAWNGLHRVNRHGAFNVPMGDRLPEQMWNPNALLEA